MFSSGDPANPSVSQRSRDILFHLNGHQVTARRPPGDTRDGPVQYYVSSGNQSLSVTHIPNPSRQSFSPAQQRSHPPRQLSVFDLYEPRQQPNPPSPSSHQPLLSLDPREYTPAMREFAYGGLGVNPRPQPNPPLAPPVQFSTTIPSPQSQSPVVSAPPKPQLPSTDPSTNISQPYTILPTILESNNSRRETLEFSLGHWNNTRCRAFGLGNARKIYLRVWLNNVDAVTGFCLHLEGDQPAIHHPYNVSPNQAEATGCAISNRLVYQLTKRLRPQFCSKNFVKAPSNTSLIHQLVLKWGAYIFGEASLSNPNQWGRSVREGIEEASSYCIMCGREFEFTPVLLRSTVCAGTCNRDFRRLPLEVRMPELRFDPIAVAVILQGVVFTAMCDHLRLLSDVPLSQQDILQLGQNLLRPFLKTFEDRMTRLGSATTIFSQQVQQLGYKAELFLSWSLTSYRGYLATCPPEQLIPELQDKTFLLFFNASPEREKAFHDKVAPTGGKTSIVFHGTTYDRLYPIFHSGLQYDQQGLIQTARVYGDGIYSSNDSRIAMGYARPEIMVEDGSNKWLPVGMHVLLICELVEAEKQVRWSDTSMAQEIYVTPEPEGIAVRALLIAERGTRIPRIDPAVMHRQLRIRR